MRRFGIGLVGVCLLAGVAAGCGDAEESTGAGTGTDQAQTAGGEEQATGTPYTVKGDDPDRPPLHLQGWVPGRKASKEYRIAYITNTPLNGYVQAMEYGAETAAKALGVKMDTITADWDSAQQINQIQTAIQQGQYDGFVLFASDPYAECRMLSQTAPQADIPVVITNFPLCGDSDYTKGTVGVSTSQSLPFYRQYADRAFKQLSEAGGGKVGIISGPAVFDHAKKLKAATEEIVKKYPNVEIAQNTTGEWTSESGLKQAQTILQTHPDVKLLITTVDHQAAGAVKALEAAGKKPGDVMVFTLGGDKATGFPLLKKGWIQGIQYLLPMEEVGQGVEMLVAKLDGQEVPTFNNLGDGKSTAAGTVEVSKENMDQFEPEF